MNKATRKASRFDGAVGRQGWLGPAQFTARLARAGRRGTEMPARTDFTLDDPAARFRLFEDAEGIACVAALYPQHRQIGLWLRPGLRGRGLARGFLERALGEAPDRPLFAAIARPNPASERLFASCGFRPLAGAGKARAVMVLDPAAADRGGR